MSTSVAEKFIEQSLAITSNKSSKELAQIPVNVRMHCFYSAKVAKQRIIDELKKTAQQYHSGLIGKSQARQMLKKHLVSEGYSASDDGLEPPDGIDVETWKEARKLTNLASTARLNLVLQQNADMANSVGTYFAGRDPDIEERFPYWRYRCASDARASHKALDGKIFRKDDPIWNTIFPPRDFNCRCWVEDVGDEALPRGKTSKLSEKDYSIVTEKNPSGYAFNPRNAFSSWSQKELEATGVEFNPEELERLKIGVDKLKGLTLRPFGENGRNKYVTATELGLPKLDFKNAPKIEKNENITPLEDELKTGFKINSKDNSTVVFDETLLNHWNEKENDPYAKTKRIPYLEAYKDTIKNPDEKWDNEGQRVYLKKFIDEKGKEKLSIVAVRNDGKAYTAYISDDYKKIRKGLSYEIF